jgi:hypothetical protein
MKTTSSFTRTIRLTLALLLVSTLLHAQQLKLGDNPSVVSKSAVLELESKTQGLLLPRIADTTSLTMKNSPNGMIIFLTTNNTFCVRVNGAWVPMLPSSGPAGGDLTGTYPNPLIANGAVTGAKMNQDGATTGQVLKWNGTTWAPAADNNNFTSITLNVPAPFFSTPATLTGNGTFNIGMNSQTANTVFASPDGAAGTGTFRSLVAADIPTLPFSKISGTVPVAQGGTGLTAVGAAGTVLTSNGTTLSWSALPSSAFTLTGDVTGSGSGSVATTIANQAVTFAKMQNINSQTLIGRYATGAGSPQSISLDNTLKLTTGGVLYADSALAVWNGSKLQGRVISALAPTTGQVLKWNGSSWAPDVDNNTGSLSSVGLTMPSIFSVANSPLTANGTIAVSLQNVAGNTVFAGPNGTPTGTPAFRALVAADIPSLPFSQITGVVPVAQGGMALTAVGANGSFLSSNGTSLAYRTLAAADIPTLPFTKISGVVPIAQGGTNLTAVGAANTFLYSNGTSLAYRTLAATDIPSLPFSQITGTVPVAQGGTGLTAVGAAGTVLTSNGTSLSWTSVASGSTTLTGDVTGSGTGSFATTIANQAVTFAKMQNINSQTLVGRYSTGAGSPQSITLDNTLKLTTAGVLYADSTLAIWNASKVEGMPVSNKTPATGQVLKWNGTAWETNNDNDGGASFATLPNNDISNADVAGTPAPPMKVWASNLSGTVQNGVSGTTASSWNVMAFRGSGFTTQLYFDKATMAVREWTGNTAPLGTTAGNGWYKTIVTDGGNNISNGAIPFGSITSDASTEVAWDVNNFFWDKTNKRLGIGTNAPTATLTVNGGGIAITAIKTITAAYTATDNDYTIISTRTANNTVTLPSSTGRTGRIFIVKRATGASQVTVQSAGSGNEFENTATTYVISTAGKAITFQSDGGTWWIIGGL